ncbi:putative dehydrogenase [Tumebacillus sp. BK434]|uniref:Gfo/Idh/MocA family protein n=1 Tax=Tumebacillus sp. BK434 TaxID=2512169 RepID=UPI00104D9EA1|nr:Gfo/Idh/MocA family oxidoreductase [Tumebacillus sp. BK434]TCP59579.1 putative dehydrogenase [Tumebacillus sp. BK434]
MTTTPFRVGVIGLGAIGERLIQGFTRNGELRVAAVADVREDLAMQKAQELGGIPWFTDYKTMLQDVDLDLVYIAVPPKYHHRIALDVLAAGKHLFCEKPLANSLQEAKEMMEAALQAGVITAINFPLPYAPSTVKMRRLIADGYLGTLRRLEIQTHFPQWPRGWQQNDWVGGREQGGFVMETGAHWIHFIQTLFGPVQVISKTLEFPADETLAETGILAKLELADGTPILYDGLSQIAGTERVAFTLYGADGTLGMTEWSRLHGGRVGEAVEPLLFEDEPHKTVIENLVLALKGEPSELYDFRSGYEVQQILESLRNPEE